MSINKIRDNYDNRRAFTTRPDRAIEMSGFAPSATKDGTSIQMAAGGTSTDFGDLIANRDLFGGMSASSTTRALFYGGESGGNSTDVDSMQLASTGNASDHGDLTTARGYAAATSNGTRALCAGGNSVINNIDFGSIAQTGNFTDFGDLTVSRNALTGICGTTRGIFAGGTDGTSPSPAYQNVIDFITINSTGNATDFGDLSGNSGYMAAANDSSGKAFFIGGATGGNSSKNNQATDVITIATTGNASEFGNLTQMTRSSASACQGTTAFTMGGANPSYNNVIQRFVMPSLGNATDFGDLSRSVGSSKGGCGSHDGIDWGSVAVQRPSVTYMPGSGRAVICGGPPSPLIETFNIPTLGNTVSFGSLALSAENWGGGCGNAITMLEADGGAASGYTTQISSIEMASFGNSADFGDSTLARANQGAFSNSTRGVWGGGYFPSSPNYSNVIDYVTIATFGNATDFGDLTAGGNGAGGTANSTRGIFGPRGPGSGIANIIDYVTIGSTGNATDFGDASVSRAQTGMGASSTRALLGGGGTPSKSNVIDYVTIGSTGNATDFGDLTVSASARFCTTNNTRIVWGGGYTPSQTNVIDFATIASTGNASDFGDIASGGRGNVTASSDSHGGLQS